MAASLSPHEIRLHQREAQRAVRLALNDVHRNMDAWKMAIDRGKAVAVALCNAVLQTRHLERMEIGDLMVEFPDLQEAAKATLAYQVSQHVEGLQRAVGDLEELAGNFSKITEHLGELVEWQRQYPRLLLAAPFREMSLTELYTLLQRACEQHQAELVLKRQVVEQFEAFAEDDSSKQDNSRRLQIPELESKGQALTTAWMLPLEIDVLRINRELESIKEEMAGL